VTLYQLLTGVLPFRGDSMAELMYKIANEEAPDIRIVRPGLPQRLGEVVARVLAKKPDERYQDGDALARDLREVLAALDGQDAAAPAAGRTIPFQPAPGAADPERTVVQAASPGPDPAATQPAGNALGAAVPASALPGYDAAHDGLTRGAQFDKTSVMNKSGAPGMPQAGGGKTGQEP
jgi:serine/threonine-protein kinase